MTDKASQEIYPIVKPLAEQLGVTDEEVRALVLVNKQIIEDLHEKRLSSKEVGISLKALLEKLK